MSDKDLAIIIQPSTQMNSTSFSFLDILLDETLIYGTIYIPKACFLTISFLNRRLPAKQVYELVLRLAQQFPIQLSDSAPADPDSFVLLHVQEELPDEDGLRTDCYIVSRYKKILLEQQLFDAAVESILVQAQALGCQESILSFLSDMLQEQGLYLPYYLGSQPFLIYTGDDVCYHILSVFAEELGNALKRQGQLVEYFDLSENAFTDANRLIGRSFQAVIGIQTYMFSALLENDMGFLHDHIIGPKYNFVLDHPIWFQNHLTSVPKDLTIFTLDRNYAAFAEKYYPVRARFFPPAGIKRDFASVHRNYGVTFIGTYLNNSQDVWESLRNATPEERFLVNRLWLIMRKQPELPAEEALRLALAYYHRSLTDTEFLELLRSFRKYILFLSYSYRSRILRALLDSGIKIDVFGISWRSSPLRKNPNFIWHDQDLSTEECLAIWQRSRIALNMMSWHKNAITERILNSMLQKAVVVTERNPYMESSFSPGEEVVLYDLSNLEALPQQILELLKNPALCSHIAEQGFQKAYKLHTWDQRASELLDIASLDSFHMVADNYD